MNNYTKNLDEVIKAEMSKFGKSGKQFVMRYVRLKRIAKLNAYACRVEDGK